ncbi:hypothetical protein V6251_13265 [Olleya sp. Ti.3.14]|uniref:hypothetical protein n=1 Tax=Olleya sp. Ti.3.14 TaxID=3121297 RepID=UPI00311FF5B3
MPKILIGLIFLGLLIFILIENYKGNRNGKKFKKNEIERKIETERIKKEKKEEEEKEEQEYLQKIEISYIPYRELVKNKDYINKHCTSLKDFKINSEIDDFDLYKLAILNNIELQIGSGWNRLVLDLVIELSNNGWDLKVDCIKEKYGGLSFYIDHKFFNIVENYHLESFEVCESCGRPGYLRSYKNIIYTACDTHGMAPKQLRKK